MLSLCFYHSDDVNYSNMGAFMKFSVLLLLLVAVTVHSDFHDDHAGHAASHDHEGEKSKEQEVDKDFDALDGAAKFMEIDSGLRHGGIKIIKKNKKPQTLSAPTISPNSKGHIETSTMGILIFTILTNAILCFLH